MLYRVFTRPLRMAAFCGGFCGRFADSHQGASYVIFLPNIDIPAINPTHPVAQRIDGSAIAAQIREETQADVEAWTAKGHRAPSLAAVLIGNHPASASYVRGKRKAAAGVGIESETHRLEASISEEQLLALIEELNEDASVDGILVQLPLPEHIDEQRVINAIRPTKDVDGFHPENAGRLATGHPRLVPATPSGILELLRRSDIPTRGRHAVIVGRSNIVGKPTAQMLLLRGADATVTVCHRHTQNLAEHTTRADILIVAVGKAGLITADMVKPGAAVIDVGINRVEDASRSRGYRLVGDVDFEAVSEKVGWITPVPGGVGPMTIAMLLRNTLAAARLCAST